MPTSAVGNPRDNPVPPRGDPAFYMTLFPQPCQYIGVAYCASLKWPEAGISTVIHPVTSFVLLCPVMWSSWQPGKALHSYHLVVYSLSRLEIKYVWWVLLLWSFELLLECQHPLNSHGWGKRRGLPRAWLLEIFNSGAWLLESLSPSPTQYGHEPSFSPK